jgi:hypothetical protein
MKEFVSTLLVCWSVFAALSPRQAASPNPRVTLDFEFFKTKVQPIFLKKRPGHARCVACHAGSQASGFKLQPLPRGGTMWTDEQSRENFEAVEQVVIPGDLRSPLLVHPLAESAGGDFFHSGGKHFNSQSDPEWLTLKAWVFGAKGGAGQ